MKTKAQIFYENLNLIHIDLKDGTFYNGTIQEINADFFMLHEMKLGKVPVFFDEIEVLELYNKPEVKDE